MDPPKGAWNSRVPNCSSSRVSSPSVSGTSDGRCTSDPPRGMKHRLGTSERSRTRRHVVGAVTHRGAVWQQLPRVFRRVAPASAPSSERVQGSRGRLGSPGRHETRHGDIPRPTSQASPARLREAQLSAAAARAIPGRVSHLGRGGSGSGVGVRASRPPRRRGENAIRRGGYDFQLGTLIMTFGGRRQKPDLLRTRE